MSISEILQTNPDLAPSLAITVKASDLQEFAKICIEAGRNERPEPEKKEKVLTAEEVGEIFKISQVTLWSWDKKGITSPVYVGKRKYYTQSSIDKILCKS